MKSYHICFILSAFFLLAAAIVEVFSFNDLIGIIFAIATGFCFILGDILCEIAKRKERNADK